MDLAACDFVRGRRNCLIAGQTSVRKRHLLQGPAHEAARRGFDFLFTATDKMPGHLHAGHAEDSVDSRVAGYLKPEVLVLDDCGLKPLPTPNGSADFQAIINERYEIKSILLTSKRAPSAWPEVFDYVLLASAALDRRADRAHVVSITGKSYRLTRNPDGKDVSQNELDHPPA